MAAGRVATIALTCILAASCAAASSTVGVAAQDPTPTAAPTATAAPTSTPTPAPTATVAPTPTVTPTPGPTPTPLPTPTATPIPRSVHEQAFEQFAVIDRIPLRYPAAIVETVGFHESGHDGSKPWPVNDVGSDWTVLDSRERDTHPRSAADVVVAPDTEIRSPVTGTVVAAQTYVLYCEHSDDLLFIEPDEQPGWQVRIFHISGLQVSVGDRVEAGLTVIAPRATQLPFVSQVDDETAEPSWPHVHIEIVDPSIPDRPTATPGCS